MKKWMIELFITYIILVICMAATVIGTALVCRINNIAC
jgi:hypothetical protein